MIQNEFHDTEKDYDLYEAYFGDSSDYYIERLYKIKDGEKVIYNWYSFFFGMFWFIYKKMYIEAGAIILVTILTMFIETSEGIDRFLNIIIAIAFGLLGNYVYMKKAIRTVESVKTKYEDRESMISYLEQKGGSSATAVCITVLAFVLLIIYLMAIEI